MAKQKYFKTKRAALAELDRRRKTGFCIDNVFKMQKGTRHHGEYAVCSGIEYLNTY